MEGEIALTVGSRDSPVSWGMRVGENEMKG